VQFPYANATLTVEPGVCVKRNLGLGKEGGMSTFQFEPSSVKIDKERNLMIVASLHEIVALPAGLPTTDDSINYPIQILYQFPTGSEDLEAIEMFDGTIYVISEGKNGSTGKDQSDTIALDWTSNEGNILQVTNRWRIDYPSAEGLAYTSDKTWFSSPKLIVAANRRTLDKTK
jgi:hypothetical protein